MTLYKFLRAGLKSDHNQYQWQVGKWEKHEGDIVACQSGFHASIRAIDALSFVAGEILAEAEVSGSHVNETDKQVWSEMRIVNAWLWKKEDSVALAIFAAEQVIDIYESGFPGDNRPRAAIEAAKSYLSNPSFVADAAYAAGDAAYAAAGAAAYAAAGAAAYAAGAAAYAAGAAAYAAGGAAAYAAGHAAYAAARAARAARANKILDQCDEFIINRIPSLAVYTHAA